MAEEAVCGWRVVGIAVMSAPAAPAPLFPPHPRVSVAPPTPTETSARGLDVLPIEDVASVSPSSRTATLAEAVRSQPPTAFTAESEMIQSPAVSARDGDDWHPFGSLQLNGA